MVVAVQNSQAYGSREGKLGLVGVEGFAHFRKFLRLKNDNGHILNRVERITKLVD